MVVVAVVIAKRRLAKSEEKRKREAWLRKKSDGSSRSQSMGECINVTELKLHEHDNNMTKIACT